jgi:hypothetical protein
MQVYRQVILANWVAVFLIHIKKAADAVTHQQQKKPGLLF